jgi:signal transduction histidine kinase
VSLRWRLFLLVGGLVAVVLAAQAWLVRDLGANLTSDVRAVAYRVGQQVVSGFSFVTHDEARPGAPGEPQQMTVSFLAVHHDGEPGSADRTATVRAPDAEAIAVDDGTTTPAAGTVVRRVIEEPAPAGSAGEPRRIWIEEQTVVRSTDRPPEGQGATPAAANLPPLPLPEELRRKIQALPGDESGNVLVLHGPTFQKQIPIPQTEVAATIAGFQRRLLLGSLALLGVGLLGAALVAHRVATPLGELARAAREVGQGRLGAQVEDHGRGGESDVGAAILAFNRMSRELAALDRRNRALAEGQHLSELGEVARGLAHTLRNPLNALGLTVEQLAAGPGGAADGVTEGERDLARREAMVESARRQVRRMDRALRSFLALASNGGAPAEPVEIAQLAREVALEALQDGGGAVGIAVEADPGEETRVSGVAPELRAVLQALVVNAVEASREGGRVQVAVRRLPAAQSNPANASSAGASAAARVEITIADRGAGVPPEVRERLFQPHTTTKSHGSGMGLFLAHRIAAGRYGGSLALEPRPDGGTIARLTLGDRESATAAVAGPSPTGQPEASPLETNPLETSPLETSPLETSHGG